MPIKCSKSGTAVCISGLTGITFLIYILFITGRPMEKKKQQKTIVDNTRVDTLDYDRFQDPQSENYDESNDNAKSGTKREDIEILHHRYGKWEHINICQNLPNVHQRELNSSVGSLKIHIVENADRHTQQDQIQYELNTCDNEILSCVQRHVAFYTNSVLVDIGAGNGCFTLMAAKMGRHTITIDSNVDNIKGICASITFQQTQPYVTILHQNPSIQMQTPDSINIDDDITCDSQTFSLDHLTELTSIKEFHTIIIRIESFHQNAEALIMCAGEFFVYFDVKAVIMPWSEHNIKNQKKLVEFLKKYNMEPHSTGSSENQLTDSDMEFWPLHVLWMQKLH